MGQKWYDITMRSVRCSDYHSLLIECGCGLQASAILNFNGTLGRHAPEGFPFSAPASPFQSRTPSEIGIGAIRRNDEPTAAKTSRSPLASAIVKKQPKIMLNVPLPCLTKS